MMKNRAGWLALIVLAIASLLMIFFVLPRIGQDAKPLGDAINAAGNAVKDAVNDDKQALKPTEAPKTGDQAAVTPAPQAAQPVAPQTTPKTGQLAPAAKAAVTPSFDVLRVEPDGSAVIAGRADPHSTLEVTDGASTIVAKTDVGPSGDFVAILDNPLPPGDHQLVLKATNKDGKATVSEETATISVPTDKKTGKLLAMVTTPGKASRLIATPEAPKPADAASQPAVTANAAAPAGSAAPVTTPALPQNSTEIATTAPNVPVTTPAAPTAVAPATAGATPALQITAVELEGAKIFIAGISKSGTTLRGLADGKLVGQTRAGSDGHFVIEGTLDLTVGDHRISVEALNNAGQPQLRVEVPFNRPVGDQVAAVAAPSVSSPMASIDGGAFDKLRNETVRAFNLLQGLYVNGKVPSGEQMAAARSSTAIALKSITEYRLPADASVAARSLTDNAAKDAATALAALNGLPNDVTAVGAALKDIAQMIAKVVGPAIGQQLDNADVAATAAATDGNGATTIQQAPLTQSARNSVIIRQGDTLWQISRRVYGQGVRYTTIYLANEDQIRNPDVIQPGQIFGVPDEYRPDSEELHRERMMQHRRS
ncbi:LysM peptidoglycan-binding domain-containing protein [Neorhizobium alkalisoli]|uniref:LysM domain-containing protein n=1 Tax=Neorhizobium alkalisoli TaxID=528178 RepID=A0A561R2L9_9HYPH|nr:LysM peptidoglycan-binding domain-containing protein [Neorhizobium alkalisoli]TWF56862.1 LysM domain-containing protein [Neorhizobium alkalisoli]